MIPRCDVLRIVIFSLFFAVGAKQACFSEDTNGKFARNWYSSFFFEGACHLYFAPEMFSGTVQPAPGFRGVLGYEWRRLRFSFASGYTRIIGTNPLVLDIAYIPLTFRLGYEQPLFQNCSARADMGYGLWFSEANLYENVLDRHADKLTTTAVISHALEGRLSLAYTLPGNFLQVYIGGNGYLLFETRGPLPRGAFEVGLVFKPFTIGNFANGNLTDGAKSPALPAAEEETMPVQEEAASADLETIDIDLEESEEEQFDDHKKAPNQIEHHRW
jgi:hypothetical protein